MKHIFGLIFSAVVLVGAVGCASTRTQESAGEYADDAALTTKVKAALVKESAVKSADVNVETYRGVVQLSGFVDSAEMAEKAVAAAQKVHGVKSVRNDMRLKPAPAAAPAK